jgi:hypothetical protein
MRKGLLFLALFVTAQGCATYKYANNVKMVSFSDDLTKGKSVGNVRGEDCTWSVLNQPLGGAPTIDKAFINTRKQASTIESAGFSSSGANNNEGLRYVNNVSTEREGFNAYLFGKDCLVVTGVGYR